MGRRTLLLIASILIAAVGTALIGLYVRGADNRARQTEGTVSALVARETIPAGTSLEAAVQKMRPAPVPARMAANGYPDPNALANIRKAQKDKVVQETIRTEQVVLESMFGSAGDAATTGITKEVGISVEMTDPGRAAGLLAPGSHVKIYLIPKNSDLSLEEMQKGIQNETGQLILKPPLRLPVILPDALVMRIGNSSTTPSTTAPRTSTAAQRDDVPRTIVTLDLEESDADAIAAAQALGDLYFAVLAPKPR